MRRSSWVIPGNNMVCAYTSDAGRVSAALQDAAEVRDFQAVLIGFEDVVGSHAVDGDEEEGLCGKSEGEQEGESKHGGIIAFGDCGTMNRGQTRARVTQS